MSYYSCLRKKVILTCSAQLHLRFLVFNEGGCILGIWRAETRQRQSRKRAQVQRKEMFTKHHLKLLTVWNSSADVCRRENWPRAFVSIYCSVPCFSQGGFICTLFWTKLLIGVRYLCCCAGVGAPSHGVWSSWESTPAEQSHEKENELQGEWNTEGTTATHSEQPSKLGNPQE